MMIYYADVETGSISEQPTKMVFPEGSHYAGRFVEVARSEWEAAENALSKAAGDSVVDYDAIRADQVKAWTLAGWTAKQIEAAQGSGKTNNGNNGNGNGKGRAFRQTA